MSAIKHSTCILGCGHRSVSSGVFSALTEQRRNNGRSGRRLALKRVASRPGLASISRPPTNALRMSHYGGSCTQRSFETLREISGLSCRHGNHGSDTQDPMG